MSREGTHSMKVTTYAPPFRPPFFRSLENLYSFDPYILTPRNSLKSSSGHVVTWWPRWLVHPCLYILKVHVTPTWGHLGPVGAPCWPHELCCQGQNRLFPCLYAGASITGHGRWGWVCEGVGGVGVEFIFSGICDWPQWAMYFPII